MLARMIIRYLAAMLLAVAAMAGSARAQSQGERAQMVVELFTSQGCIQCPRANRLLGMFAREDDVLTASAAERWRAGRAGIYEVEVRNQHDELVALFRGRSHRIAGRLIDE